MVHAENGVRHRPPRQEGAGGGRHRSDLPRAHAPEEFEAEATGRAIRLAEYADAPIYIVHVSCKRAVDEVIAARAARRAGLRRDLHPVPLRVDRRPAAARLRGRAATSARRRCATPPTSRTCGTRSTSTTCSRSRPTTARSPTSRSGSASATSRRSRTGSAAIQHRLPLLWEARRQERPDDAQPLRRGDVARRSRRSSGCTRARARSRPARTPTSSIFDPDREHVFSTATSFMNVDYDLWEGQKVSGVAAADAQPRQLGLRRRQDRHPPGHGRFVKRSVFEPS